MLEEARPGGGTVFVWLILFPVDSSSTPCIGVLSVATFVSALERFVRLHAHLIRFLKQARQMCSRVPRWLSAAPVGAISLVLPSVLLSAMAAATGGRSDGRGMCKAWTEMA